MMERPKFNQEIALRAARKLVESMVKDGLLESSESEQNVLDISRCAQRHMDGYAIARALEDQKFWSPDAKMVEALDVWCFYVNREIMIEEREWVEKNNIKAPYPNGTRVRMQNGKTGTIKEDYKHYPATFLIEPDEACPHKGHPIIKYEDVTPL